jgi:hypothetical protein
MGSKTKKAKEVYFVFKHTEDNLLDFEETFSTLEEAKNYVQDRSNEYANDDDAEESYEWRFIICKQIKTAQGMVKVTKKREIVYS